MLFITILCFPVSEGYCQVLGGSSAFNFLKLPNSPQLTALGGINISNRTNDIGLVFQDPAMLRADMSGQLQACFNLMFAGIRNYSLIGGYHAEKINTDFAAAINYLDYGTLDQTDPSGNLLGRFRPFDYMVQVSAARTYEAHWRYGFAVKFIQSNYGTYRSSAFAIDAAGSYYDSLEHFQAALVIKNMGTQWRTFVPGNYEQLPFDIQLGISKKLAKAPIQFSFTAHHLHQFNLQYSDSTVMSSRGITFDKIFQHFVCGAQFYIEDRVELSAGYNHLRRSELNTSNTVNGLTGFSLGVGVISKKLQLRYARSWYQNRTSYHQLGLNMVLF